MIRTNELAIGNYVGYLPTWKNEDGTIQSEGNSNNPIICKVEMLGGSGAQLYNGEDNFDVNDIELYPIPLTSEILDKNGFKKNESGQWVIEKKRPLGGYRGQNCESPIYYAVWVDCWGIGLVSYLEIEGNMNINKRYVHQLQNMLHSYGLDEYIKIEL